MKIFSKRHPKVGARPGTLVIAADALPPRVTLVRYDRERLEERVVSDVDELASELGAGGVVWVDVQGLGDERALRRLAELFALHPLALEDIVNIPQRPKAEAYDDHLLLIARQVRLAAQLELEVEQVTILIGAGYVVTFQERHGSLFEPVRARLRAGKGAIRRLGADYLGYCIFDTIIDAYYPVIEQVGDTLESLEDAIIGGGGPRALQTLTRAKNLLTVLRRAIWPQREAANILVRDPSPFVSDEVRVYLRDTHDHCVQTAEVTETYRELVSGLVNTYLTVVANRTNAIMKVLTIMASIFIPLTFLAGFYGMNFKHMPELDSRWGYPIVIGVMIAMALLLAAFFYFRGWLGGGSSDDDRDDQG